MSTDLTLDQLYERYGPEELPSYEWMKLMGWPTDVIVTHPTAADHAQAREKPYDPGAAGRAVKNWARSFGSTTDPQRLDREHWPNGCYVELGYQHASLTVRWGRASGPGNGGGQEGSIELVSAMTVDTRTFLDDTLKELAHRE